MRKATAVVLLALALTGCGGSEDDGGSKGSDAYPAGVKDTYMGSCVQAGGSDARSTCECVYDWIVDHVDYEDFKEADRAIQTGETTSLPDWAEEATKACT